LSDPGKALIQLCNEEGLPYSILPGANALIPAVVGAGFPTNAFRFIGFLPQKNRRQTALQQAIQSDLPTFFYESVHRMEKLVTELRELNFTGRISIAREISKLFEQFRTGDLVALSLLLQKGDLPLKGEFVVGISP